MPTQKWTPPDSVDRQSIIAESRQVLASSKLDISRREDLFTIESAGLPWDIGVEVFEPSQQQVATGPDGRHIGVLLLHGGGHDGRSMAPVAEHLSRYYGYRVVTLTYPGHLYLLDDSRDWPGETIKADGTVRTPLWSRQESVAPDEYTVITHRGDEKFHGSYGTIFFAEAKPGTRFYLRMAAWPMAYEEAIKQLCGRYFPDDQYTVYMHGHSTGGPIIHMMLQRVSNVGGLLGVETSPFGCIMREMVPDDWDQPFNRLTIRTWRDLARYRGTEEGVSLYTRLPRVMEEILDEWASAKRLPGMKAQHIVQFGVHDSLAQSAMVVAEHLKLGGAATARLVDRYTSYIRPLTEDEGFKLPPLLYGIASGSRDHTPERYDNFLLPWLRRHQPGTRNHLVKYGAGVHKYYKAEEELPFGILPSVAKIWTTAIETNYFAH